MNKTKCIGAKNIIAICFAAFYIFMLAAVNFSSIPLMFKSWKFLFNIFTVFTTPIFALIYFSTVSIEYSFKKLLLPIAFGTKFLFTLLEVVSSISYIEHYLSKPIYIVEFLSSLLLLSTTVLMFVGTIIYNKTHKLLMIGVLAFIVVNTYSAIINFFAIGGFEYLSSIPKGLPKINVIVLIKSIAQKMFYIGTFVASIGRK